MNFSDVFVDSLRYPFTDIKKILTLFLFFLGSVVIIPGIMANGYLLRIIEHTFEGSNELPDFDNKNELLGKGLELIVVNIIYSIPAYLLLFYIPSQITILPSFQSFIVLLVAALVIEFIVNMFLIMGIGNLVFEKKFGAAFAFKRILELIKKVGWKKYLAYIVVFTIIVEVFSLIVGLLSPFMAFMGMWSLLGTLFITLLFNTYLFTFGSRFKGLIYPLNAIKAENEDLSNGD
ncbi:MAG: hypothetical protein CVV28_06910 [Methanobacteriales archaeon HGW-Methanobacteriales-1]|jgi:hypothetical protein|nr:MAG: hypothetical protein CVV28_06910 [Methanobacteriales archaeon HGW-Methanobacteriales-1]